MPTFTPVNQILLRNLLETLTQLRRERADMAPDHSFDTCRSVCRCCTVERQLNRMLDRLPRKENV